MNDHTHDLDPALAKILALPGAPYRDQPPMWLIGTLYKSAGFAVVAAHNGATHATGTYLADAADIAMEWVADVIAADWAVSGTHPSLDNIADLIRAEYDRAHTKHDGNTPANPAMSDHDRAAILLEEVGEVARALTPDAHTETGHAGNLADELIQTATMAAAWLQHLIDQEEAEA